MPAKAKIVTRSTATSTVVSNNLAKGSPLSFAEIDSSLINLRDQTIGIAADSGSADVAAGDTISIVGGTGITTSTSGRTITIEGTSQAQGITVSAPDSSTIAVADGSALPIAGAGGITISTTGNILTIDGTTINNAINIDGGVANSTYGGTTAINGGTSQ
jgi:hypothetical protein